MFDLGSSTNATVLKGGSNLALAEKKIEIIEVYFKNGCRSKIDAIKEIDPTIKQPKAYAWKLFNEPEVKAYIAAKRREMLKESGLDLAVVTKGLTRNLYGSLGIIKRTVLAHGKNGFDTITGNHPDSIDTKNYWGVLRDILGSELSTVLAMEDVKESKDYEIREENLKLDKQKLILEKQRLSLVTQEKITITQLKLLETKIKVNDPTVGETERVVEEELEKWKEEGIWNIEDKTDVKL